MIEVLDQHVPNRDRITDKVDMSEEQTETLQELLQKCATSLTEKASQGELAKAYGREDETNLILTSLASPLKGRIIVTGGPRVGKTATIKQAVACARAGKCPESLRGSEFWSLSARSILRAFGVAEWQDKLGQLMAKWVEHPEIILVIDALPDTQAAGATAFQPHDMAQFLLGQLQSSENRLLAEGRTPAVNGFLEAYPDYRYLLMDIRIAEPTLEAAHEIVRLASQDLEIAQGVAIRPAACDMALDLTNRFSLDEQLPGKAIDLISETVALQSDQEDVERVVTRGMIIKRYAKKTGLPIILLDDEVPYDEKAVQHFFADRVLGQKQAIDVVVQSLSLLRTRLNNPRRPMGVFLFVGPTGVGKTELARALAEWLFSDDQRIVRFNMADYPTEWDVDTLFGDPDAYNIIARRGQLTMRLMDRAFAIILLDEFEKAHPNVFKRCLQLFDEGMLINGASEKINLRNSIVILTSNFGAKLLSSGQLGFGPAPSTEDHEQRIRADLVSFFSPELINRIDSVLFFKPLDRAVIREIAYRRVQEILRREGIRRREVEVDVDEEVIDWVVDNGYSQRYGARYLARQIEKTITYPLAQQLIRRDTLPGMLIRLTMNRDRVAAQIVREDDAQPAEAGAPSTTQNAADHLPDRLTAGFMKNGLSDLRQRVAALEDMHHLQEARDDLADLMQAMSVGSFWDDPAVFQPQLEVLGRLTGQVDLVEGLRRNLDDLETLLSELDENDHVLIGEAARRYRFLVRELPRTELTLLFRSPLETYGAYIHVIVRGRQRTAATHWLREIAHMYLGWATRRGLPADVIGEDLSQSGETRGVWIGLGGYGTYGLLAGETGIHRLTQAAPGKDGHRQTIQARVTVWPDIPADADLGFDDDSIAMQTKTVSKEGLFAHRLQTVMTGAADKAGPITMCSAYSSQELAPEIRALLRAIYSQGSERTIHDRLQGNGRVARSYVRFKQRYVQDPRTRVRTGRLNATLQGQIDPFIEAYLRLTKGSDGSSFQF